MAKKTDQLKEAAQAAAKGTDKIIIRQPEVMMLALEVSGTADLIQNNFSQKSIEQMLRKHMGITVTQETKKPREVIEQAKILNQDGKICLSPVAFKSAMVAAASTVKSLKKTQLRIGLFVEGGSVPIKFEKMEPRMDIVRVGGASKVPDVRFRPSFINWSARMIVQFSEMYNAATIVDLLQRAGTVGVGEWRPEKNGTFGTFRVTRHIEDKKEIADIRELCKIQLIRPTIPSWAMDLDIDANALSKLAGALGSAPTETDDEAEETLEPTEEQKAQHDQLRKDLKRNGSASV
jgi:hypothetical protein